MYACMCVYVYSHTHTHEVFINYFKIKFINESDIIN